MNRKRTGNSDGAEPLFDDLPFDLPEAPARAGGTAQPRAGKTARKSEPKPVADTRPHGASIPAGTAPPNRLPLSNALPPPLPPRADPAHAAVPEGEPPRLSISERALRASGRPAGPPYLEGLNPEQRAAVEALDGPVLVLAGAGTGKTRVLTTRIAHILASGRAWPSQVLAVTFTNKAAREMKERIGHLVGGAVEGMPWLGTFHSICVKILRRHAELVGLKNGFTILDSDDQLRLMKQVIDAAGLDKDRWPARQLAGLIDGWKNRGITPAKVSAGEAQAFAGGKGRELYAAYQARLKELNACDFGDLLLECLRLFMEHPDVLADYQRRFRFILVDEYQDTNVVQYLWLRLLAQGSPNVCCVGDDDQCLAAGTLVTMGDGSPRAIEAIAPGEEVLSCFGSGEFRPAKVMRVHRGRSAARATEIVLRSGRTLRSTPQHVHFAGYRHGITPQTYFVYLMEKRGVGFRLGTSQVYTSGQKQPVLGFQQRALQEHADAVWIVATFASEAEARFEEIRLSLAYAIPTLPFTARKGASQNGLVHDSDAIARLYAAFDTTSAAQRLLGEHGLRADEPHHRPRSRNSSRRNVVVTLCGDRRGLTPMHRLSIVGNDREGAELLAQKGFSVRPAKAGSASWRVETARASWRELAAEIERIREVFDINVIRQARLGADNSDGAGKRGSNSLAFLRAQSIRPGMVMLGRDGYDVVERVAAVEEPTDVFDLDIEATHNFVANGIVTHNSIYGWRGAEVDNILRFEHDFPGATVIRLERNYRSTSHILAAASGLIAKNRGRLGKTLFTDGVSGDKLTVTGVWDDEEEARIIGEDIEQLQRNEHKLNEIAVLVRASFQMRSLEDRFVTLGLPYRVIGGPRFYERQEIKDAIAYLDVTLNPANDLKFERIVNVPKRGFGDTSLKHIRELARARGIPLFQAALEIIETEELGGKARRALADLTQQFARWRSRIADMRHTELAELILDESGYTAMWQADKSPQSQSRLENLKELVRFMDQFDTLEGFLEHVSLVMDTAQGDDGDRVSLMTLHAAKGLEFDTVFLPGWEEGLFPHQRALDESGEAGLEEERRLAYVGITRAKKRARISFAQNRRTRGLYQSAIPSRFVDELPEANVDVIEAKSPFGGAYQNFGHSYGNPFGASRFDRVGSGGAGSGSTSSYDTPGWKRAQSRSADDAQAGRSSKPARYDARSAPRPPVTIEGELIASSSEPARYAVGERVFHQKFGYGRVTAVDGNKLSIDFDKAGSKRVVDSFVQRA